ncbi:ubiquitin-like isoform X1 [Sinocyclocheilus anshuiensis]|uniref:ubiquitin-like isoform X1 n=1 Tax=Sinocyclocheilus anshuiensis TaxID=1608454 RepID=UPI0007B8E52C|nr:PREDICTED: ubiquitin-like isoform X1 [Sinocyclocheilus anshuiensis]
MSFNIFIKYEIGQLRAVSVDSEEELKNTTVEELRRRAFPEDQWDALVFIFEGRQLEEGRTLGSYGVLNESTIHAVLRLRGGALPPPEDEDVGMSRTASMEVLASMQQTEPEPNRSCLIL